MRYTSYSCERRPKTLNLLARTRRVRGRASGFSLLEILISIVILSFGLLGMVGMQATALQSNKEARYQSSAVRMAGELGELMRNNQEVGTATTTLLNPYLIDWDSSSAVPSATTNCLTGDCYSVASSSKLQVATFDVREWLTRLETELPGARVKVCFDSSPYDASGIPQWACNSTGTMAVIKIGWTRGSTDKTLAGAAAFEKSTGTGAKPPSVVVPVTSGLTSL